MERPQTECWKHSPGANQPIRSNEREWLMATLANRPSGAAIKSALEGLKAGTYLRCTQNDRVPQRVGMIVEVVKPGRTTITVRVEALPDQQVPGTRSPLTLDSIFYLSPPSRVGYWDHASDMGFTYRLDGTDTVKWAVL